MVPATRYHFRPAALGDLALLTAWQQHPHVARWWDDAPLFDADDLADPRVSLWVVALHGTPFAYMQDYSVHGWGAHPFAHLPSGSRGIDQFIGDPALLYQGHGRAFIAAHMRRLFAAGASVIATDPHPENDVAICVYQHLGFRIAGPPQDSEWGQMLPMLATVPPG